MNAISVTNLRKSFGKQLVLDDINLQVSAGSIFCLLGPNGAGKTTTINILATLLAADSGDATVNGFNVKTQADQVREQISLTGQFAAVDDILTARENLILIGQLRHIEDPAGTAAKLLAKFGIDDAAERRAAEFSGGMRRRLDIAMGLIGDAPVIFLDEPTTGLDPHSRIMMWQTIKTLAGEGTTVFLTTQNLDEADRLADRIAILNHGKIVAEGTAAELKRRLPYGKIELSFPGREQLDAAAALLEDDEVSTDAEALSLTIATDGTVAAVTRIFTRIQSAGIDVSAFTQKTATLDDAFLKIIEDHEDES